MKSQAFLHGNWRAIRIGSSAKSEPASVAGVADAPLDLKVLMDRWILVKACWKFG